MIFRSQYPLKKSKKILHAVHVLYKRKKKGLADSQKRDFESLLTSLHEAIQGKKKEEASELAKKLKAKAQRELPKNIWDKTLDFFSAVVFFLIIVIVIRQMWFEFYRIPSGSMRPTLKEKDFLAASKTDFGLNIPLYPGQFYFDADSVQRGSIFIFTVANMDVFDPDTMYFFVIPGKKQFVKRLIAKGGDTLYFYGGQIYGIDKDGRPIEAYRDEDWFTKIEHIPFIHFNGKVMTPPYPVGGLYSPVFFYQMNEPVAKLSMDPFGQIQGTMIPPKIGPYANQKIVRNYYDLWGFKNFATTQMLTHNQVIKLTTEYALEEAPLYLEITHHPTFHPAQVRRDELHRMRPSLTYTHSILPLSEELLRKIFDHMTTARFIVKNEKAYRYGGLPNSPYLPKMKGIPNGVYEFENGKAFKVDWSGMTHELSKDHPLYTFSPERVQLFYNLGIEFDTRFSPNKDFPSLNPSRYAYFRNQSLYLLGHPILKPGDPTLTTFLKDEKEKAHPFIDSGPPLKEDGSLDIEFIQKYGLTIPDESYLALGDNHAMSSDSRDFGFVPQSNIRGGANFLFWPPSSRWGFLPQPPYPWLTFPKLLVWSVALIVAILTIYLARKRARNGLKF